MIYGLLIIWIICGLFNTRFIFRAWINCPAGRYPSWNFVLGGLALSLIGGIGLGIFGMIAIGIRSSCRPESFAKCVAGEPRAAKRDRKACESRQRVADLPQKVRELELANGIEPLHTPDSISRMQDAFIERMGA